MLRLIMRRLALGVLVALTVMTLAFMLTRLSGDLAISIAGPQATQADIEIVRKAYGLDRPLTCSSSPGSAAPWSAISARAISSRTASRT